MKEKIKKLWLEALRSGEYKQSKDELKNDNGYCCLGVLCDLHRKITKKKNNKWDKGKYLNADVDLPKEVMKWAKLDEINPTILINKKDRRSLAELNDNGKSFKQIANFIEKHL